MYLRYAPPSVTFLSPPSLVRCWYRVAYAGLITGAAMVVVWFNTSAIAQLANDGYGIQAVNTVPSSTSAQNALGSGTRFHKQVEWKRIKAFLNEASQEGFSPDAGVVGAQTNRPNSLATGVSANTKLPIGFTESQLQQLCRYEATVYGKVYLLQLHGPDTPDKRLHRLEQTLQLSHNRFSPPIKDALPNDPVALTEARLAALKAKMDDLGIAISDGDQQKVSEWAIALMEARVFQGGSPSQTTEERVRALESAVFGLPASSPSPVRVLAPVPNDTKHHVTPQKSSASLAKRVAVLGEQFPVRLRGLASERPSSGQPASLNIAAAATTDEVLDEVEFVVDETPAAVVLPSVVTASPVILSKTILPSQQPITQQPQALLAVTALPPSQPSPAVWFKQSSHTSKPQSAQSLWEHSTATEPLHVFVAASSPEELHAVLLAVELAASVHPLQVVRYSQLADVWITGSVATPLPPGLSPHRVLRLQRDCAVTTRAAVPWGTCIQQWLSAHKP